jgi:hypothetical protein
MMTKQTDPAGMFVLKRKGKKGDSTALWQKIGLMAAYFGALRGVCYAVEYFNVPKLVGY